ncbi:MAG: sigma-70 family RNA polymerase sigma factor [Defluviitaleaceae bacterium]|nr:sigma-70 family RNA polymerase sigma factor [Defluviitaleaceae bacterium]MCL2262793.1 sigma-70 family RNA polymerase sigma factor [Defluviitaleaceae bacterium]
MLFMIFEIQITEDEKKLMERICDMYHGTMLYVANSILKDPNLAEDAVSESFVKMTKHLKKFHDISCHQTKSYIVSIVKTTSYDMCRKMHRKKEAPEDFPKTTSGKNVDILKDMINQESYETLLRTIMSLPDQLKNVLYLHTEGYSHDEIAKTLGISYDNSKKRLSRARQLAKKALEDKKNEK